MTSPVYVLPLYPVFHDLQGKPLDAGYIYIGIAGGNAEGQPLTVYWDEARTIPAEQPIRTIAGYPDRNGSAGAIYVAGDYSITVRDKNRVLVYSAREGVNFAEAATAEAQEAADVLRSFALRLPYSFDTDPANGNGRGPYALQVDPQDQTYLELYLSGIRQQPGRDFNVVDMPAAASGKGVLFTFDMPGTPITVDYVLVRPLASDPNAEVLTLEQFGVLGNGAGDQAPLIQSAIVAAAGRKLIGTPGAVYRIETGVAYIGDVNIDFSKCAFFVAANVTAFRLEATPLGIYVLTADYVAGNRYIDVALPEAARKPGQPIKIYSEAVDPAGRDEGSKSAQSRHAEWAVVAPGSTASRVYLTAPLAFPIAISPTYTAGDEERIPAYSTAMYTRVVVPDMSKQCEADLGAITYEDGHDADPWNAAAVRVRGYVGPKVRARVQRGYQIGIALEGTWGALVENTVFTHLTNDTSRGQYGYGVANSGGKTTIRNISGSDTRHLFTTTNSALAPNSTNMFEMLRSGRTTDMLVDGVVYTGGVSAGADTHADAERASILNVLVGGLTGGQGYGVNVRGRAIRYGDVQLVDCDYGVLVMTEWATDAGDVHDDKLNNGKTPADFTSATVDFVRGRVREGRALGTSFATASFNGSEVEGPAPMVLNEGGTQRLRGSHRLTATGGAAGAGLLEITAGVSPGTIAFPTANTIVEGGVLLDGTLAASCIGLKVASGQTLTIAEPVHIVLPATGRLLSATGNIVCVGNGLITYEVVGAADDSVPLNLAGRSIRVRSLDGTINYDGPNGTTIDTGFLRLRRYDPTVSNGEHMGGIAFETNDVSNPAMEAARLAFRGAGTLGYVDTFIQRSATAGTLLDAMAVRSNGDVDFFESDGAAVGARWDASTGKLLGHNHIELLGAIALTESEIVSRNGSVSNVIAANDAAFALAASIGGVWRCEGQFYVVSSGVVLPEFGGFEGVGVGYWDPIFPANDKTWNGTNFLFKGQGARGTTIDKVSSLPNGGGWVTDPDAGDPIKLWTARNSNASGATASTAKAFSVAVKNAGRSPVLRNVRVVNWSGTNGISGHSNEAGGLGDEWDIGVLLQSAQDADVENVQAVGDWREVGMAIMVGDNSEKMRIERVFAQGVRGLAVRGYDRHAVTATTASTVSIPWSAEHYWGSTGTFRGSNNATYTYTGLTFTAGSPGTLTFTGVTPNPTGIFHIRHPSVGIANSVLRDVFCYGLDHVSGDLSTDFSLPPSTALEVSGNPLRGLLLDNFKAHTAERVVAFFGDCSDLLMDSLQLEGGGHVVALPQASGLVALETRNLRTSSDDGLADQDLRLFNPRNGLIDGLQISPPSALSRDLVIRPISADRKIRLQNAGGDDLLDLVPLVYTTELRYVATPSTLPKKEFYYQRIGDVVVGYFDLEWTGLDTSDTSAISIRLPVFSGKTIRAVSGVIDPASTGFSTATLTAPIVPSLSADGTSCGIRDGATAMNYNNARVLAAGTLKMSVTLWLQ
jgi:hypothetical protein